MFITYHVFQLSAVLFALSFGACARMQCGQRRHAQGFIKKYNLPFPLLLDPDHKIATAYGAANGIPILGLDPRITYVIDENGKILKVYPQVDPAMHADEILSAFPAEKTTYGV